MEGMNLKEAFAAIVEFLNSLVSFILAFLGIKYGENEVVPTDYFAEWRPF